jgi:hypothetical protein
MSVAGHSLDNEGGMIVPFEALGSLLVRDVFFRAMALQVGSFTMP